MKITFPPVILLASIVLQIILLFSFPISVDLSSLLGLILILSGISLVFVSFRFMRKMKTTFIPDGTPEVLISSGPFKFSRNPIYLGMLTVLVGVAFLMSSLSAIIIAFVFGIIINFTWIAHEEKKLHELFSEDWENYSSKVRRWI
ncbi:isoprenylcysteine carboxylmethyltransferase family protein [SAR86 cluster bacterium]|jgi:protein-S-isoprenylcysteine O-methyltransferase Ste14|nr:isoprenylcysteine carboxylmethyltransferase family protein [SAR86 cluster bacterium]|tara:strand:- start:27 stop:461 length:435 start_codon:yes stop_codon:yes gene_type:complete